MKVDRGMECVFLEHGWEGGKSEEIKHDFIEVSNHAFEFAFSWDV